MLVECNDSSNAGQTPKPPTNTTLGGTALEGVHAARFARSVRWAARSWEGAERGHSRRLVAFAVKTCLVGLRYKTVGNPQASDGIVQPKNVGVTVGID